LTRESELLAPTGGGGPEQIPQLKLFLEKLQIEKELQQSRAQSLKLDLDEIKELAEQDKLLVQDAAKSTTKSMFTANSRQVLDFQAALRLLNDLSERDKKQLRDQVESLEMDANKVSGFKQTTEQLVHNQELLQAGIIHCEREATELLTLSKTGDQLEDAQASIASELSRQLDNVDARVERLGTLVMKMHREKYEVESTIMADISCTTELASQLQTLASDSNETAEDADDNEVALLRHT